MPLVPILALLGGAMLSVVFMRRAALLASLIAAGASVLIHFNAVHRDFALSWLRVDLLSALAGMFTSVLILFACLHTLASSDPRVRHRAFVPLFLLFGAALITTFYSTNLLIMLGCLILLAAITAATSTLGERASREGLGVPAPLHALILAVGMILLAYALLRGDFSPVGQQISLWIGIALLVLGTIGAYRAWRIARWTNSAVLAQYGVLLIGFGWNTQTDLTMFALRAGLLHALMSALAAAALRMQVDVAQSRRSFLINGASLIGAPPFAGFVAKLMLFQMGVYATAWLPLGLMALCSAFLLVSAVRAWERLPAGKPERGALAPRVLSVLLVILGLLGTFVVNWAQAAVQ